MVLFRVFSTSCFWKSNWRRKNSFDNGFHENEDAVIMDIPTTPTIRCAHSGQVKHPLKSHHFAELSVRPDFIHPLPKASYRAAHGWVQIKALSPLWQRVGKSLFPVRGLFLQVRTWFKRLISPTFVSGGSEGSGGKGRKPHLAHKKQTNKNQSRRLSVSGQLLSEAPPLAH